jgi:antitoxin component HigA of HigAB toxin-antitoxin module
MARAYHAAAARGRGKSGPNAVDMLLTLGLTHADIAAKIGWSRTQASNVINGRFGASRRMVSKVLELAHAA